MLVPNLHGLHVLLFIQDSNQTKIKWVIKKFDLETYLNWTSIWSRIKLIRVMTKMLSPFQIKWFPTHSVWRSGKLPYFQIRWFPTYLVWTYGNLFKLGKNITQQNEQRLIVYTGSVASMACQLYPPCHLSLQNCGGLMLSTVCFFMALLYFISRNTSTLFYLHSSRLCVVF